MEYVLILVIILFLVGYAIYTKINIGKSDYKNSVLVAQNHKHIEHRNEIMKIINNYQGMTTINSADVSRILGENEAIKKDLNGIILEVKKLKKKLLS